MATSLQASFNAFSIIEDQITCPVCLEHYTNPKLLPCSHSLCLHCLQHLPTVNVEGNHSIDCPTCRSPCLVPDNGLASLPPSFVINKLMKVYDLMKTAHVSCGNCDNTDADRYCKQCGIFYCPECLSTHNRLRLNIDHQLLSFHDMANSLDNQPPQVEPDPRPKSPDPIMRCTDHNKPLEIFCETCQQLICHNCTIRRHRDHDYDVVNNEFFEQSYQNIVDLNLKPLVSELDRLKPAKESLEKRRIDVSKQAEETIQNIHNTIEEVKNCLDKKGRELVNSVDSALKDKQNALDSQLRDIDSVIGQVTECMDYVDQCIKVGSPQQVLLAKPQMMSRTQSVITSVKEKTFEPLEQADIRLVKNNSSMETCKNIGKIEFTKFKSARLEIYRPSSPMWGRQCTVKISFNMTNGSLVPVPSSLVKCHLTPPDNTPPIQCSVKESSQSGQYNVLFKSFTRGTHKLYVTVRDKRVLGSPVNIPILAVMEISYPPVTKTITGLNGPSGVAVTDDGLMVVSETEGNRITILDKDGKKVISFGRKGKEEGQLQSPQGVAITSRGTILVADTKNHRIQEFTLEGECISCVGSRGNGHLQFKYPHGIAIDKRSNRVFVADNDNHRIQVLRPNLKYSHTFGNTGYSGTRLFEPHDVAIDKDGYIYITDFGRNRVTKFTAEGQFMSAFGTKGSQPGQLYRPSGIAIDDNGFIGVNNMFSRYVTAFNTSGQHVNSIDKRERDLSLLYPPLTGMASDKYGRLLVCRPSHNELIVL